MDLHFTADQPDSEEIAAVDECLAGLPLDGDRRQYLLPVLHALQGRKGWVSPGALNHACLRLEVPPAEAFGVADFYALFQTRPHPPATVHVCDDIACRTRGAEAFCAKVEAALGPAGESQDGYATWHRSPCLGLCERAPAALVIAAGNPPREQALAPATARDVLSVLAGETVPAPDLSISVPQAGQQGLKLLARVGRVDPTSLDDYRAAGGFLALRRAFEMSAGAVVKEVVDSKLVGRGGAAFPTGVKWQGARSAALPRYLICNADESEPGTFKDRVLMENDPFSLIEAMTIAGFATGCEKGFLYLRGEYPLALARLENAIERCLERGYLGENILGDGVRFDIELRRGAGAYICGEETALMNSLEGRRGEPRNKPPFPTEFGLFGKPTIINNVETLVNVLDIVVAGGAAFAATGTPDSTGTRLFCVSGDARVPGLYEVPMGTTLRALIDLAGGLREGRNLQAVLLGGAAGSFVTESQLDVPLSFEGTRAIGATLGSGAVIVLDDTADVKQILLRIARFFRDESCGQCVPCRVGTVRQEEVLHRLLTDRKDSDIALLSDIAQAMRDASICGLGQTAANAIASGLTQLKVINA